MTHAVVKVFLLFIALSFLIVPLEGVEVYGGQATVTLDLTPTNPPVNPPAGNEVISRFIVTADDAVKALGYTVNGVSNCEELSISGAEVTTITILTNPPQNQNEKIVLINSGISHDFENNQFVITINPHRHSVIIRVHLSLVEVPVTPNPNPNPGEGDDDDEDGSGTEPKPENPSSPVNPPGNPVIPVIPEVPDTPVTPDIPDTPVIPDVPEHPDTPGSDEPYRPILPPADNVYNFAGFIPLLAGFLLLLLLFFLRGNLVYRILVKNAKKHGEKPDKEEKEHLKQIASAIVSRIRDEEKYPEWRKNSDVMKRLWFDIESVLDEMNYAKSVPRGAVVAEIIKAARGRINRNRL